MTAAIYLRQSSDPNNDQLGITRQREDCIRLCQDKGWDDWREYVDNDTSASSRKPRPAYTQLLNDIRSGDIKAVVVWHMDRLHRQPAELEQFIEMADAKSIALATVTGDVDLSTDTGRLVARITGAVARAETERKVARSKRRYRQDAEAGRSHFGPSRAFGYRPDETLDPDQSDAVRTAYADVLAGRSLRSIAAEWNSRGFKSARGHDWTQTGVRAVILNPRNAGFRAYHGEIIGPAVWPPIVDRDVFDGAVAVLRNPARNSGGGAAVGRKYLMSGLALCGVCGSAMTSAAPSGRGMQYRCRKCFGASRNIEAVDNYVLDIVAARLSMPDAASLLERNDGVDISELRSKAEALRKRQDAMASEYAEGNVTMSQMRSFTASFEKRINEINNVLLDHNRSRIFHGVIEPGDREVVRERLDALDLSRRRAIVDALLTLTVLPGQRRGPLRRDLLPVTWKGG